MAGKFFILQQVEDFAPGYFAGTAVEDGCVQLGRTGGAFEAEGSYTSPAFTCEDFFSLIPSWNADVPPGTSVEFQARVAADGRWSGWVGFGRWSPYLRRASEKGEAGEVAVGTGEALTLVEGCPAASRAQMRVLLRSGDGVASPKVRLMALSTNATQTMGHEAPAFDRRLAIPAYSCQMRDPGIAERMASATTVCMLANRYGQDLLPEEVARTAYDFAAGTYSNLAFLCAAAGAFGFSSHLAYTGVAALRREVWQGRAVAARVHYRAPALGGEKPNAQDNRPLPPVLEGANWDSTGHLVAVRGFFKRDGTDYVLINDPLAPNDDAVPTELALSAFATIYTGLALFLGKGPAGAGADAPRRKLAQLTVQNGEIRLRDGADDLVPGQLGSDALTPCTLCYTLGDGIAYASAAQRKFYYPGAEEGVVHFERYAAAGRRMTVYLIGPAGNVWVGERQLEATNMEGSDSV